VARFRDFDGMARLTLLASAAATLAFLLPWVSVRLGLQNSDILGLQMPVLPLLIAQRIGTPDLELPAALVALLGFVALVAALGSLVLILAPGLQSLRDLNPAAGRKLCAAGLATSVLAALLLWLWVGPALGVTSLTYGAALAFVGFALGIVAWPRAHRLGDDEAEAAPPPTPS
jgi:hypothetical protein